MARKTSQPASRTRKAKAEAVPVTLPPMTAAEEQNWAMLAHLSVLVNLFTGSLGPVVALLIYLTFKDRSRYVAFQALQATFFQLVWWLGLGLVIALTWVWTGLLSAILIGLFCIPFACLITLLPLYPLAYGVIGGVRCSRGEDFVYPWIGPWVRRTMMPDQAGLG